MDTTTYARAAQANRQWFGLAKGMDNNYWLSQLKNDYPHISEKERALSLTSAKIVYMTEHNIKHLAPQKATRTIILRSGGGGGELNVFGNRLFTGRGSNTIKMFDLVNGQCLMTFNGHTNHVNCLTLHGDHLFSGSNDHTARMWEIANGNNVKTFNHDLDILQVKVHNQQLITLAWKCATIWDITSYAILRTYNFGTDYTHGQILLHEDRVLTAYKRVRSRQIQTEKILNKKTIVFGKIIRNISIQGPRLLTLSNGDGIINVVDFEKKEITNRFNAGKLEGNTIICFNAEGDLLWITTDQATHLYSIKAKKPITSLMGVSLNGARGAFWSAGRLIVCFRENSLHELKIFDFRPASNRDPEEIELGTLESFNTSLNSAETLAALHGRGSLLAQKGFTEYAITDLARAHALAPHDPDIKKCLFDACVKSGKTENLIRAFQLDPDHLSTRKRLSAIYAERGTLEGFNESLKYEENYEALWGRASLYMLTEQWEEALADLQRAVELQPGPNPYMPMLHQVYINLGCKRYTSRTHDFGLHCFENALRIGSSPAALAGRGIAHLNLGNWAAAINDLKSAHRVWPTDPFIIAKLSEAHTARGEQFCRNGYQMAGINDFKIAQLLNPATLTDLAKGLLAMDENRWYHAIPHLEKAVEKAPLDGYIQDRLHFATASQRAEHPPLPPLFEFSYFE